MGFHCSSLGVAEEVRRYRKLAGGFLRPIFDYSALISNVDQLLRFPLTFLALGPIAALLHGFVEFH
jgi:hypothetical protein